MQEIGVTVGLKSGFVLAIIILTVLLADRLGGSATLTRRAFQVALGVALALAVVSGTAAFHPSPDVPEGLGTSMMSGSSEEDEDESLQLYREFSGDNANNASENQTIHLGIGIVLLLGAIALVKKMRVLPLSLAAGGLLLLLFGAPTGEGTGDGGGDALNAFYGLLVPVLRGEAGQARDLAQFLVLAIGTACLAGVGYQLWERGDEREESLPAA